MIRDYGQAASDLQRLISILEDQPVKKTGQYGTPGSSNSCSKDLKQAYRRMSSMENEAKKGISLDLYLVL